jgi:hypothetical protein
VSAQQNAEEAWLDLWAEAHDIVVRWEASAGRLLPVHAATDLTRRIAQAMQRAYQEGKSYAERG